MSKINIQPKSSIYSTFRRLSYTTENALAEYVDNSTASYFKNLDELSQFYKNKNSKYKLNIYIKFFNTKNNETSYIEIIDNAFGMKYENFERAVVLNKPPEDTSGRSEFGMGLKTAGVWFSNVIQINSTELGSENRYSTTIDVEELIKTEKEEIDVFNTKCLKSQHGTSIKLTNLNNPIKNKTQKINLAEKLSEIYRNDIETGDINIFLCEWDDKNGIWKNFYNEDISNDKVNGFLEVKALTVPKRKILVLKKDHKLNNKGIDWEVKHFFEEKILFEEKEYKIKGWIGVLETMSSKYSGLYLFRRGRVIVGAGPNSQFKINSLSGQTGSPEDKRIIGKIELDNFPVAQTKDSFSWENGLKNLFIETIEGIKELSEIKMVAKKLRSSNEADIKIFNDENLTIETTTEIENNFNKISKSQVATVESVGVSKGENEKELIDKTIVKIKNIITKDILKVTYFISKTKQPKKLFEVFINDNEYGNACILFVDHYMIKPFSEKGEFLSFFKIFIAAVTINLIQIIKDGEDPSTLVFKINKYLEKNNEN